MRRQFTNQELGVLKFLLEKYNGDITYQEPRHLEAEYLALTGIFRASGCLYMAAWRMKRGLYDERLSA